MQSLICIMPKKGAKEQSWEWATKRAGNGFVLVYLSLTGVFIKIQDLIILKYESALMSLFQKELTGQLMNEKGKSSDGTFLSQI